MKKITFILIFASTLLFSNESYLDDQFKRALDSYQNRLFQDSYFLLSPHEDKLDRSSMFILARSAYEIGRYEEAQRLYEEILKDSPKNDRVKLELAQTYFKQKKFNEARVLYKEVLKDESLPINVRKNIEKTLMALDQRSKKDFFKTNLTLGYGHDSNAKNTTSDDYVYIFGLPFETEEKRSSGVLEAALSLNHTHRLSEDFTLDNKLVGYMQDFERVRENDLSLIVLGTGISYYQPRFKISLGVDFNYVWLNQRGYLSNYALVPSIDYQIDKNLIYRGKLRVIKKDFHQKNYNFRDSTYYELSNSLALLTKDFGTNIVTLTLGNDNKKRGTHHNVDYKSASLRFENIYPLLKTTLLFSGVEFYIDKYKEKEELLYNKKRKDEKLALDLGLLHSLNKNFSLGVNGKYIDNYSNQSLYKYDKYILKTNLYYTF